MALFVRGKGCTILRSMREEPGSCFSVQRSLFFSIAFFLLLLQTEIIISLSLAAAVACKHIHLEDICAGKVCTKYPHASLLGSRSHTNT